jgi:hypothetical protein
MRVSSSLSVFGAAAVLALARAQGTFPYIPPGNQLYLGAWPDAEVSQ